MQTRPMPADENRPSTAPTNLSPSGHSSGVYVDLMGNGPWLASSIIILELPRCPPPRIAGRLWPGRSSPGVEGAARVGGLHAMADTAGGHVLGPLRSRPEPLPLQHDAHEEPAEMCKPIRAQGKAGGVSGKLTQPNSTIGSVPERELAGARKKSNGRWKWASSLEGAVGKMQGLIVNHNSPQHGQRPALACRSVACCCRSAGTRRSTSKIRCCSRGSAHPAHRPCGPPTRHHTIASVSALHPRCPRAAGLEKPLGTYDRKTQPKPAGKLRLATNCSRAAEPTARTETDKETREEDGFAHKRCVPRPQNHRALQLLRM